MKNVNRVLMFSQRNIYEPEVWRCPFFEFEEIIRQIDSVELLAPKPKKWFNYRKNHAMRIGKYTSIIINPGISKIKLKKNYDLFFAICEKPTELLNVNVVENFNEFCKISICLLPELWVEEMNFYKSSLRVLSKFDYVFTGLSQSRDAIESATGRDCSYLAQGVDNFLFVPYPKRPKRFIDVFSLGRREENMHIAFMEMARENQIFYVYDTLSYLHSPNIQQHRFLISNMAKRSYYFTVNPGKFDVPTESGNQSELGTRYFEGAASGSIMIGRRPVNAEYDKLFFWPDSVIELSGQRREIEEFMHEMDRDGDRQRKIRENNVVNSLLYHDWVYRWETVLKTAGLDSSPELAERKNRLKELAGFMKGMIE